MSDLKEVLVPDLGGDAVQVIEICVQVGDVLDAEDSIITVESDKATMDIPAPFAGKLAELKVAVGDTVSEGTLIALLSDEREEDKPLAIPEVKIPDAQIIAAEAKLAEPKDTPVSETKAVAKPNVPKSSQIIEVAVPDIGDATDVEVIEVLVAEGDTIDIDTGLLTLETDKATMEVPSPAAGVVKELRISLGDKVSMGSLILLLDTAASDDAVEDTPAQKTESVKETPVAAQAATKAESVTVETAVTEKAEPVAPTETAMQVQQITVPDIGDANDVDVIEVLVAVGETVSEDQGLITLETDKATVEVPSPFSGKLVSVTVDVGDKVSMGSLIATIEVASAAPVVASASEKVAEPEAATEQATAQPATTATQTASTVAQKAESKPPVPFHPNAGAKPKTGAVYASPSVRRLAREFGVDLTQVTGSGRKGRVVKEDVQAYVKYELSRPKASAATAVGNGSGLNVIDAPVIDFSKFGNVEQVPLSRIQKISGPNLHRNWVTIPHVTQFDEADITELEAFRKQQNDIAAKQQLGIKITPLVFMMKAAAKTLQQFPVFNSSLSPDGESLIQKKYFHIGIAVDTPNGLMVPVVRDVDKKGIHELSKELAEISVKAREGKLKATDMQGSCFTISSLGGIGGTAFTPIVNYPDVAILGVSKSEIKPKWNGKEFEPKLMLPLSLSYDHRVIDGAMAAKFSVTLAGILSDIRQLIL